MGFFEITLGTEEAFPFVFLPLYDHVGIFTLRAGFRNGFIPGCEGAVGVFTAPIKCTSLFGTPC